MSGISGLVKVVVAMLLIFAAATGTEVVDVIELADKATIKAQSYFNEVEVEGDETELFDEAIDDGQVFARPTDKSPAGALAYNEDDPEDSSKLEGATDPIAPVESVVPVDG